MSTEEPKGKEIKVGEGGNGLMWRLGVLVDELGNRNGPHFKPDPTDRGLNFVAKLKEKGFTLICDNDEDTIVNFTKEEAEAALQGKGGE